MTGTVIGVGIDNKEIINFVKYKYDTDVHGYMAKLTPIAHELMTNYLGFKYHFN